MRKSDLARRRISIPVALVVAALVPLLGAGASAAAPVPRVRIQGGGSTAIVGRSWRATLVVRPASAGRPAVALRGPRVRAASVRRVGPGRYAVRGVFTLPGRWRVEARLRGRRFLLRTVVARAPAAVPIVLRGPSQIAVDAAGRLLISQNEGGRIDRVDPATGQVQLVRTITSPYGIALSRAGELYATSDDRVLRLEAGGGTTVVGRSDSGLDIGPVVVDDAGNAFYFTDGRIYRVDRQSGAVTPYAGTGSDGFGGDGGPADQATFGRPHGLAFAADGALLVSDSENGRIRRIDPVDRVVRTVATGLGFPTGLAVAGDGSIYVGDVQSNSVHRVAPGDAVTRVAGTGVDATSGDGGPAAAAALSVPSAVAISPAGTIYVTEARSGRIRRIDASGTITSLSSRG